MGKYVPPPPLDLDADELVLDRGEEERVRAMYEGEEPDQTPKEKRPA